MGTNENGTLMAHIDLCHERYRTLSKKLDEITQRLDKMNGRWWTVMVWLIVALGGGCVSMLLYIWINQIGIH